MVYFVNICEGTGIRKIVTNILKILLRWTGYVTDQISQSVVLAKKSNAFARVVLTGRWKKGKKNEVWQYQRNRTLRKLDVWPNVIFVGFIYYSVHHLGSVTKTNKPALGRVGRIRVEKQWKLNWNYLNYLRIKVNDQNETLLVLFAFMKSFGKYFTRMFFILSMASDKEVSGDPTEALGDSWSANLQAPTQPWCVWVQTTASGTTSPSLRSVCGFFYVPLPVSRMEMKATRPAA